jgi:hypothetical protein
VAALAVSLVLLRRIPREIYAILGGLIAGITFAQVFVWLVAKDTAATYEAYVGPALERAGVSWPEITATIERGAARAVSDLVADYAGLCQRDPLNAARRRLDCKEIDRLRGQRVPHE